MSALINEENPQYDSLEPMRRKTTVTETGLTKSKGDVLLLNLKDRKIRLSVWVIGYFIFSIAELTANSIMHRMTYVDSDLRSGFSLLIAANVFLFIGCILAWVPMHGGLEATGFLYIKHLKYTAGFLFILCAILHWPAMYFLSQYGFCTADKIIASNSYCRSYVFAYHWMGHFFAICIGLDICDLKSQIFDNKRLRMDIYAVNICLMFIILGTDVNYFYKHSDNLDSVGEDIRHAIEAGYFVISVCCGFLVILIGVSYCDSFETVNILHNATFRSLLGVCLLTGSGLIFFIVEVAGWAVGPQYFLLLKLQVGQCNLILSLVPILMIVYDLQTYDS